MESFKLTAPVVFIIFNKIETTKKVFDVIKKVRPSQLFIIADGPRRDRAGEQADCNRVREITESIDWDCKVLRNYSDENLGLRKRIISGLDWVFQSVEEAIILEDDCLPDYSFFKFCQDLLTKYRNEERVLMISGNKILSDYQPQNSYYFSQFSHIWGWATWKRVWKQYDFNMSEWSAEKINDLFLKTLKSKSAINYWKTLLLEIQTGEIDAWSVRLQLLQFIKQGLTVVPSRNLVVNLGFDSQFATNTKGSGGLYNKMKLESLDFPLSHPKSIFQNFEADKLEIKLFHKFGFKERVRRLLLKFNIKIR